MSTTERRLKESCLARADVRRDSGVPAEAHAFRRRGTREDAHGKTPRTEAPRGRVRGRVPDDAPRIAPGTRADPAPPGAAEPRPACAAIAQDGPCAARQINPPHGGPHEGHLRIRSAADAHCRHRRTGGGTVPRPPSFAATRGEITARNRLSHCETRTLKPRDFGSETTGEGLRPSRFCRENHRFCSDDYTKTSHGPHENHGKRTANGKDVPTIVRVSSTGSNVLSKSSSEAARMRN